MAIRGNRIPFFGHAIVAADGESRFVKLFPVQERIENGRLGLLDEWKSRPGYDVATTLDTKMPVRHLAHDTGLVAIAGDGRVFRSDDQSWTTSRELDGTMEGSRLPQSVLHDGLLVATDGGTPMGIETHRVRQLGIRPVTVGAPTVLAVDKGNLRAATYRYRVSMTTAAGQTRVGPPSDAVDLNEHELHGVLVSRPAFANEDDQRTVLAWSIWRESNDTHLVQYVATLDASVLQYHDTNRDLGETAQPVADASYSYPPKAAHCAVVGDYLVLGGIDDTTIQWSAPGGHDFWPPSNFTSIPLGGGSYVSMIGFGKELVIFCGESTHLFALTGNVDAFERRFTIQKGCMAPASVVVVEGDRPYWLGHDGIFYRTKGLEAEPIGPLEQNFVWGLKNPRACEGRVFLREKVVRWTFPEDGVTLGFNYAKDHFFRDYSWNGSREIPLGINAVCHHNGTTFVGLSDGRIGTWSDEHQSDAGMPIRTVRRFSIPLTGDGRRARANSLMFRHQRGTVVPGEQTTLAMVSWGFDQGPQVAQDGLSAGGLGDTSPYAQFGPCGVGREMWVQVERTSTAPFTFTGGMVVAQPLGDGL